MGLIRRYRTALARHHRSRGFGIHSPSAYRFVTEVLRERCHYYAYEEIRAWRTNLLAQGERPMMSEHEARLLFRVVNHFAPQRVLQVGPDDILPIVTTLLTCSTSEVLLCDHPDKVASVCERLHEQFGDRIHLSGITETFVGKPFIMVHALPRCEDDYKPLRDTLQRWLTENEAVVILRNLHRDPVMRRLWHEAKAMMSCGHTFTNEKTAIMVSRHKIPHQDFSIWM